MIYFLIILNVAIAWWNCYSVGQIWNHTTTGFENLLKWSAAIQSIAGFSIPIIIALTALSGMFVGPETSAQLVKAVSSLWYLIIVIPVVGSGFIIWGHSVREAIRNRSLGNIGIATYNTVAQASNTISAFSGIGDALSSIGELFGDEGGLPIAIILLVIGIVVVSLFSSVVFTLWLIKYYADKALVSAA